MYRLSIAWNALQEVGQWIIEHIVPLFFDYRLRASRHEAAMSEMTLSEIVLGPADGKRDNAMLS